MDEATRRTWEASPFGQCMQKAREVEQARRIAPDRDWWKGSANLWAQDDDPADPTANEALGNIRQACQDYARVSRRNAPVNLQNNWRGVDWDHLKAKAHERAADAENIDRLYLHRQKQAIRPSPRL